VLCAIAVWCFAARAEAQTFDGYASVLIDRIGDASELRSRVFADYRRDLGSRIRFTLAGFAEGLLGDRGENGLTRAAILRPQELNVEARWRHADLRAGFSRVVWGRLDEFLPTDVVNPQDLTRFFLEGRSEGRMPVAMVRARWLPSDAFSLEAIYVPVFRRGRFDQLDEETAPFNIAPRVPVTGVEPARAFGNAQGGVRASATTGRVDWAVSAYRGFESLPLYVRAPRTQATLIESFPRFTMVGADFETVQGEWGVRGELAAFVARTIQAPDSLALVKGRFVEAGFGIDRKAGNYRVSGTLMFTDQPARNEVTLVGSIDRSFARETRSVRAFAVYNPREQSAFARVIASASLRDNLSLEGSGGWFTGDGVDILARFADRDFAYPRLKVFF
jgi:hypothetical protein